jgi:TonB family protein
MILALALGASSVHATSLRSPSTYPKEALDNCIEGYVVVRYAVSTAGRPEKIEVLESEPKGVFDQAAVNAVSSWRLPKSQSGSTKSERIKFELEQACTPATK